MRCRTYFAILILLVPFAELSAQDSQPQTLTVFAATSLTDVFESLRAAFIDDNPDVGLLLNFSSSSTLAAQLIQGAPADIFASANELQMDLVSETDLIDPDAVEVFANNQLVLIAPADNPAEIETVADLAEDPVLLVLAAEGTPIRAYTDAMFASYGTDHGADFVENVMLNLVSEESNVRQVVTRIALGEADAGIVYRSDAIGDVAEQLSVFEIEPAHNQLASYPIAPVAASAHLELARRFIAFILSTEAQPIFAQYGFCSPAILTESTLEDPTPEPTLEAEASAAPAQIHCPAPSPDGR